MMSLNWPMRARTVIPALGKTCMPHSAQPSAPCLRICSLHPGLLPATQHHPGFGSNGASVVELRTALVCRSASTAAASSSEGKNENWLKALMLKVVRWVTGLIITAGVVIAALPAILSTQTGLAIGTNVASLFVPGVVRVREVDSGWRKPLTIKDLQLKESGNSADAVAEIKQISTSSTLLDVVRGKDFDMIISEPVINAAPDANGEIPLMRYVQKAGILKKSKKKPVAPPVAEKPNLVTMSGEVKMGQKNIFVSDGKLYVGDELRFTIGKHLHWLVAQGDKTVENVSEELNLGSRWMEGQPSGGEALLVSVDAPNLGLDLKGWKTSDGIKLGEPVSGFAQCTPLLVRECLALVNPMLGDSIKMTKGAKVQVQVDSSDMQLPSKDMRVHIEPIQVVVDSGPLVDGLLDLLSIKEKGLQKGSPAQAWLSGVDLDVKNGESVNVRRWDVLLGSGNKGLHAILWGKCNTATDKVDMYLGIPAGGLARAGFVADPGYVLAIPVKGTVKDPIVDWAAASNDLGRLALERVGGMISGEQGTVSGFFRSTVLDVAKNLSGRKSKQAVVPKLTEPLPWK